MMRVDIYDVGHGGCSVITPPNGEMMMVDCGYQIDPAWFPSIAYAYRRMGLLAFNNLDEDHLEDLPFVWQNVEIGSVFSNPTVDASALAAMKREHGMGDGVRQAYSILRNHGAGLIGRPADLGVVRAWAYWNRYGLDFTDTNNLSPAIFVRYGTFTIMFAGDLETAGWRALLRVPGFAADLRSVRVFMASHHGRENGCCEEVFQFCRPDVFVMSDEEHKFDSQDTNAWYRQRARGLPDFRQTPDPLFGFPRRFVLTTRCDGTLSINVRPDGGYLITPQYPHLALPGFFGVQALPAA